MHRDTVIGIVGVVILVAAMVGVFTYERGQASSLAPAGGATENMTGPSVEGNVAVQSTADETLTLNQTGMRNVTFTLRWTPGDNSVDTLVLRVAPSNGTGMTEGFESDPETDGEITLTVPVNNTAADGVVGVGDWQVSVEFVGAAVGTPVGQPPIPPAAVPPGTTDGAVDFTVETAIEAYATS